jgi:uncharacterized membrane protein (UPF0136 family)
MNRATALKIAGALGAVWGVYSLVAALPLVVQGADALPADGPPFEIMVGAVIFGILRLVAAYPTWQGQRWGIIVTVVMAVLDALAAAPGVLFAPATFMRLSAVAAVLQGVVTAALCLWRDPKAVRAQAQ